jgi:hypothetical protein
LPQHLGGTGFLVPAGQHLIQQDFILSTAMRHPSYKPL